MSEVGLRNGGTHYDGEMEDVVQSLDGSWSKNRKTTDHDMTSGRQRKISHRKVIIHDDGEICNKTYNKECPYAHDPDHDNPPLLHEAGDSKEVERRFKLSMSGMSPFSAGMSQFGGGMMNPGLAAALMGGLSGKNGVSSEVLQSVAAMQGIPAETLQNLPPEQLQGLVQTAAMQSMMGGMMGGGGDNPAAMMQMMAAAGAAGGGGGEAMQNMMQMASMGGLPPAAVMQMMAAGGGEGVQSMMSALGSGDGEGAGAWEQFIKQSLAAGNQGFFKGI